MTTLQTRTASPTRRSPVPVTREITLTFPRDSGRTAHAGDEEDEEWAEFLSLGARVDPADTAAAGWRHAPVLLSY